ncbi:B3/B4 domain-containing protein [Ornithinimicrobium sp. Y1694]|uniref:B3/B4 domain-containing protein n=1 Tax=Ornithinimicrobium sp. Y1694 TaxID=3418590 RepID=UPI003CEE4065
MAKDQVSEERSAQDDALGGGTGHESGREPGSGAGSEGGLPASLAEARVDPAVFELRPDYRALLVVVEGIRPAQSDADSEALLRRAEASVEELSKPIDEVPHVASWRAAYRGFGAKPQRTRNSLEALMRRAEKGLPRVNRLTDVYNAISVLHRIPLGGEDLDGYVGAPHLIRASGEEDFDTTASGQEVVEHPEVGEVVWCDDEGVTCRRWNWRQGRRTALHDGTTRALFILDGLEPVTDEELHAAADELVAQLSTGGEITSARRMLR